MLDTLCDLLYVKQEATVQPLECQDRRQKERLGAQQGGCSGLFLSGC